MSLFKKEPKLNVIELFRDKEVIYRVTVDPDFVQFESASKDWLVRYSAATFAAGMVNYLIANNGLDELMELVRVQYMTMWMFKDAKVIKEFYREIERSSKRMQNAQKREDDAVVLAEQKVLREQTVESINELENLKKKKK